MRPSLERRVQGDVRVAGESISQSERAPGCQFREKPIRQRLDPVFLLGLDVRSNAIAHCAFITAIISNTFISPIIRGVFVFIRTIGITGLFGLGRHVLGQHEAPLHLQCAITSEADEGAGPRHVSGIERQRPFLQGKNGLLDLAQPCINLVRIFVGPGVFSLYGLLIFTEN